jgi:aromatic ring-opening dioxygenase catalytic subunit (LigB family)
MAEVVLAVAASHAPGLTGWPDKAGEESRRSVEEAYARLGAAIADADLDVLVMVANDHIANFPVTDYPDFVLGMEKEHSGPDEWFKPWLAVEDYTMPGRPDLARALYDGLTSENGYKLVAWDERLRFDDNISVPVTLTGFSGLGVPLLPVIQNCTVPPVPDERRSYDFGRRMARAIREQLPDDVRVGLFGSGGLSHEPGGPKYLSIDDEFDRWFLDLLAAGDHERILREATFERMEKAGAGGTAELLSWLVVLGAIGERPCEVLCYEAVSEWRCGVGAVQWSV